MVEKAKLGLNIDVVRYVGDLRLVNFALLNAAEDKALLNIQLQ